MISFYLIQKHCKNRYSCEGCYFAKGDARTGYSCIMDTTPDRWPMMRMQKAYDELWKEDKTVQVFYKQVADRMLDVMGINKKEGDEND